MYEQRMNKFSKVAVVVMSFIVLTVSGCSKTSNEEKIKEFLEVVLNAPNEKIAEVIKLDPRSDDYTVNIEEAMEELLKEHVSKDVIENQATGLYQDILMYQGFASQYEKEFVIDQLEVKEHGDSNYTYEAKMHTKDIDESFVINGSIQLNDKDEIDYMTIDMDPNPFVME